MDKKMRVFVLIVVTIFTFCSYLNADQHKKTPVEKLLDILKEKEIITQTQYKELKEEFA